MREYTKEDALFVEKMPYLKKFLYSKLLVAHSTAARDYPTVVEDLIHDSFIIYRKVLDKHKLEIGKTITEKALGGYIMNIIYHRYIALVSGQKPNYYEHVPHVNNVSLEALISVSEGDSETMLGDLAPDFSEELKSNCDNDMIINHLYKLAKSTKEVNTLTNLLAGNTQKQSAKMVGLNPTTTIKITKKIRENVLSYLGKEFDTFKDGIYAITDKRTIRSLKL